MAASSELKRLTIDLTRISNDDEHDGSNESLYIDCELKWTEKGVRGKEELKSVKLHGSGPVPRWMDIGVSKINFERDGRNDRIQDENESFELDSHDSFEEIEMKDKGSQTDFADLFSSYSAVNERVNRACSGCCCKNENVFGKKIPQSLAGLDVFYCRKVG